LTFYQKLLWNTVNSRFKKDLQLQIQQHKAFFSDDRFVDSLNKSFLNQTTLDLRKEQWNFLNREFTVSDLGLTLPHLPYLHTFDQNLHFLCKKINLIKHT
jgi:hypothetical protein